jgi:hypothetical protein
MRKAVYTRSTKRERQRYENFQFFLFLILFYKTETDGWGEQMKKISGLKYDIKNFYNTTSAGRQMTT